MDRRRQRRFCTEVMGWARNEAIENRSIVVADISATGCRIVDHEAVVAVGDRVALTIATCGPLAATVRWASGGAVGLEFDTALDTETVLHLASLERTG